MELLPTDSLFEICKYLCVHDFSSLIQTCSKNYTLACHEELWIEYIKRDLQIARPDYKGYPPGPKLYCQFNFQPLLIFDNIGCAYVFQRGSHIGQKCGSYPLKGYRYCKGCLNKACVRKQLTSEYTIVPKDTLARNIIIKSHYKQFLLTTEDLVIEEFPTIIYVVGKLCKDKIKSLNDAEKFKALSLGLRFNTPIKLVIKQQ